MKKIGIDLDNVVFDVQQEMIDIYNETHNPKITKKTWNKYYLRDVTGILLEEETQIFKIMDARGRFKNMNLLPHAKDCLTELSREYNIIPVTSRHKELTAKETLFCLKKIKFLFIKLYLSQTNKR